MLGELAFVAVIATVVLGVGVAVGMLVAPRLSRIGDDDEEPRDESG